MVGGKILRGRRRVICWLATLLVVILSILSTIVILRALLVTPPLPSRSLQAALSKVAARSALSLQVLPQDKWGRAERLAGALRIKSISYERGHQEREALLEMHQYLRKSFPLVHGSEMVRVSVINSLSLLYEVRGSSKTLQDRAPYLLLAHLDVVAASQPERWESPPFGGQIVNRTLVYGRGALDDKGTVMGIMEALEFTLSRGERPERSFYIAFGHDEELLGVDGAKEVAAELRKRGVLELDFILDEGTPILQGLVPGVKKPVAMISVTEKGYLSVEMSVRQPPGHSSFPPKHGAIGILAAAIERLENSPHPSMFGTGPETGLLEFIAPELPFWMRLVVCNLWIFSWLASSIFEHSPLMHALMRTTTAVTVVSGGEKENVVPGEARAVVNHRVHPSSTLAETIRWDVAAIADPRVHLMVLTEGREAHPVTPYGQEDLPFQLLAATVRQVFNNTLVAPGVMIANTDTRWFLDLTKHIFRFLPVLMQPEDTARYHGVNERIHIQDYQGLVEFYYLLMKNADVLTHPLQPDLPLDEL